MTKLDQTTLTWVDTTTAFAQSFGSHWCTTLGFIRLALERFAGQLLAAPFGLIVSVTIAARIVLEGSTFARRVGSREVL